MPAYAYRAVEATGRRVRGTAEAATAQALAAALEGRGLLVLDVAVRAQSSAISSRGGSRRQAVLEVTRALAALLPAGMPLAKSLGAAANVGGGEMAGVLAAVRQRVERGEPLAGALAEHPAWFPPLYVGLVHAGERSGDLAAAFVRLAAQLERDEALRSRLLSASVYPLLLAAVGTVAVAVLLVFVLPRFAELLEGAGATLPPSTAALLAISAVARRFWWLGACIPVLILAASAWVRGTEDGRRGLSTLLLRLPLVGTLRRYALAARFARLAGVLLSGGAPLLGALRNTHDSLTDPLARDEVARLTARVREGVGLNAAIAESDLFPPLLAQLVAVGEESGRLRDFLVKAADIFEDKTERVLQRLVALAEPAMIVAFGLVVGFVALSLLQAVYGINAGSFR